VIRVFRTPANVGPQADVDVSGKAADIQPRLCALCVSLWSSCFAPKAQRETSCRRIVAPSCKREAQSWERLSFDNKP